MQGSSFFLVFFWGLGPFSLAEKGSGAGILQIWGVWGFLGGFRASHSEVRGLGPWGAAFLPVFFGGGFWAEDPKDPALGVPFLPLCRRPKP